MALDKAVDSAQLNTDLTTVADAIRAKGGTQTQLAFPAGFVSAVQAIAGVPELKIVVTTGAGASVTATKGDLSVSGTADSTGVCTLTVPETGVWSITCTLAGATLSKTCEVKYEYPCSIPMQYKIKLETGSDPVQGYDPWTAMSVYVNDVEKKKAGTYTAKIDGNTVPFELYLTSSAIADSLSTVTLEDDSLGTVTYHPKVTSGNTAELAYWEFTPKKNVLIQIYGARYNDSASGSEILRVGIYAL